MIVFTFEKSLLCDFSSLTSSSIHFYITAHISAILSDMSFSGGFKDDRKYIDDPFNIVCHIRLLYDLIQ